MRVLSYPNYDALSEAVAKLLIDTITAKPDALVCVASGHTPTGVFTYLRDEVASGSLDISKVTFVSLDEWLDIDPADPGSCISMLRRDFFDHLPLRPSQIRAFNVSADLEEECSRMNEFIQSNGGLDSMLVGIGLNGHIGMNEPGTSFDTYAHISQLAEDTIVTGQKYFSRPTVLKRGITLGLRHFADSRLPIVMANGVKKAPIIGRVLQSRATETIPATIVHQIPHSLVMIDHDAEGID